MPWPAHPLVYEVHTWAWLGELEHAAGRRLTLADVPETEIERLAALGFDALWLMGVWQRSPRGREIARSHAGLHGAYQAALPDWAEHDIVGSPYAVHAYRVDPYLGGDEALARLRERLRAHGLRLVLDFVPNHLAVDHAWTESDPTLFVRPSEEHLAARPHDAFRNARGEALAHGRDPYFDGWTDTVQLDYRRAAVRRAMRETLCDLAGRCDGLRCDMAMLVLRDVFRRTWGGDFEAPGDEFWPEAIAMVKRAHPAFVFIAEVYWGLERELHLQGFDYTYDKRLYDLLRAREHDRLSAHLRSGLEEQSRHVRFVENHDEERAADAFGDPWGRGAALFALALPGLRLVHEGQLEGRRRKLPVQLGRRADESADAALACFYQALLPMLADPEWRAGAWAPLDLPPGVVGYRWTLGDRARIVVANLWGEPARCRVPSALLGLDGTGSLGVRERFASAPWAQASASIEGEEVAIEVPGLAARLLEVGACTA